MSAPEPSSPYLQIDNTSPSIQTHLQIIQGVISRMAGNSSSCKSWCITIVAAILVVVADKQKPELAWVAVLPTLLFAALDAYYLGMEMGFRRAYDDFIQKLHNKTLTPSDLFSVRPSRDKSDLTIEALKSFSVWAFYLSLIVLAVVVVFATKSTASAS